MKNFCIIGLGSHARNKIIPSLINIKNSKIITITRNPINTLYNFKNFKNLDDLDLKKYQNFLFIISTPPQFHFKFIKKLIKFNCNIAVEKPAIIKRSEYNYLLKNYSKIKSKIFLELFYYKHTNTYLNFFKEWKKNYKKINRIDIFFTIPSFPKHSFRKTYDYWYSYIFDIGCYPIDLLNSMKINPKIQKFELQKNKKKIKIIYYDSNKIINITFGIGNYKNVIKIFTGDKKNIEYTPFFYSRESTRTKIINNDNTHIIRDIKEQDSIKKLFNSSKKDLLLLSKFTLESIDNSSFAFSQLKKFKMNVR